MEGDSYSDQWNATYAETCLILKAGTDIESFNNKISNYLLLKYPANVKSTLFVRLYSDKYLYSKFENGVPAGGRIDYVRLFSAIALFTLAIACINFMNLSTAQASRKMKEVSIKKAMGVNRIVLVVQFLMESMMIAFLSLIIATLLVTLLLPQFGELTNKQLHLNIDINSILWIVGIVVLTGFAAGCYPAFYLSAFSPVMVLKGKLSSSFGERWVRNGLVIIQFTISIIFMVGFFIVHKQIEFTQTKNMGYNKDNVIRFQRQGAIDQNDYEAFISEIKSIPGVVNVSSMFGSILNKDIAMHSGFSWDGQAPDGKDLAFPSPTISYDFIETLGIEISEGRSFSSKYAGEESKVVVNEAAVKMMGLRNPVGKTISYGASERQIIGVVKDFHYGSLHNQLEPVIFMYAPRRTDMVVKIIAGSERMTIENLQKVYTKFHPGYPFEFTFMDDDYQALYDSENRVSILSTYFAVLATIISCLGLFGLAAFTTERRMKEIGIRKILGSSEFGIAHLLSADFTKMVILAIVIALPISYLFSKKWLDGFAYRIDLEWWFFIGAGIAALLIAWLTVGLQTIKAARINPTDCLKSE